MILLQGGGIVHLTGYLMETPEYDFDESDFEEEEIKAEIKKAEEMKKILAENKKLGDSDSDEDEDDSDDDDDNMLDMEAEEEVISLIYENVIKLVAI